VNTDFERADKSIDDGYAQTAPVGSYPEGASPYGALDMAGNVSEWVADWYGEDYYEESPYENPPGPERVGDKVDRGGDWADQYYLLHTTFRGSYYPFFSYYNVGFRCVSAP